MEKKSMETEIIKTFQNLGITKYKILVDPKFITATVYKFSEFNSLSSTYGKGLRKSGLTDYFFVDDKKAVSIWFVPQSLVESKLNERTF